MFWCTRTIHCVVECAPCNSSVHHASRPVFCRPRFHAFSTCQCAVSPARIILMCRARAMGLTLPEPDDHFPAGHTTSAHHASGHHPSEHHIGGSAFDRSVSARRNHHSITCTHCRRSLLLAGKGRPPHPVRLTCPACLHSFTHGPVHRLIWRDAALTAVFAVVIFALSVFALDHYQLISLAQLEAWQWLADIAARIAAALGWVGPD